MPSALDREDMRRSETGMLHFVAFLWQRYVAEHTKELAGGQRLPTAEAFVGWATAYLANLRPVEVFALDTNYGFRLNDNSLVALCPLSSAGGGEMQECHTVPIT